MSPSADISDSNSDPRDNPSKQSSSKTNGHSTRGQQDERTGASSRALISRLLDDVSLDHTGAPILACCFISGICDSVAFNATGTFASMQTGNTIFLALGASHLPPNQPTLWLRALVSIVSFWAGCFLFAQFHRWTKRPQRKLVLATSFLIQTLFIVLSAALAQSRVLIPSFGKTNLSSHLNEHELSIREAEENDARTLVPLALLAFQFGGQIVSSRVLGINEVPTNVLTSLYCDLLSDPLLMAGWKGGKGNKKRDRRVVAIILLIVGGVAGGWLQRSEAGMSAALWIAAGIKGAVTVGWLFWRGREPKLEPKNGV
ncbi:hypothetical protein QBC37DRAFT_168786 [Rhypophila decipiens]|uniref:DUF1275 domain protein n=1 Tax=Rhypophila decipiens TaxID=261697 RepID=A0AAN6Y9B5_9PEZI|nr:hypothetical protein QBC37DRAFT_168786 [Rhypophila decipiens]